MLQKWILFFFLFIGSALFGETWNVDANGTWSNPANWNPASVPNSPAATADFGSAISAPRTVTIDGTFEINTLTIDSGQRYTLTEGILRPQSAITVNIGSGEADHKIESNIELTAGPIDIVNNSSASPLALTGSISGPHAVNIDGPGFPSMVIFEGNNSYTGNTTWGNSNVRLQGTTKSLQGIFEMPGRVVVQQDFPGILDAEFSAGGGFVTIENLGSGIIYLTRDSSAFQGTLSIEKGELNMNATMGNDVVVGANGKLSGNATILDSLSYTGTLSPGNSIGVIKVGGNLIQTISAFGEGTLIIEVSPDGRNDELDVTGSASLNNLGTLAIEPLPGFYTGDERYTFLKAAGGITGEIATVTAPYDLSPTVEYFATTAVINLNFVGGLPPVEIETLTGNDREIAEYIFCPGFYPTDPDLYLTLNEFIGLPPDVFVQKLPQFSPVQFGALPQTLLQNNHRIADTIAIQTENLFLCNSCKKNETCKKTKVWVAPIGQWQGQRPAQGQIGYNAQTFG
ncbi:MAG: hypothetical protein KDK71_10165, partial [Chlamydiia bacterium]|nr:hypothetical protein [Chlamydiia bacterium]